MSDSGARSFSPKLPNSILEDPLRLHPVIKLVVSISKIFKRRSGTLDTKPTPGLAATSGVVASIEGLTKGLAVDLAPAGIRVNLVGPGAVGVFTLG